MAILKRFCIYLWFIIVMTCTMVMLMWAVYSIPVQNIRENVFKSARFHVYETILSEYSLYGQPVDDFVDALMLNIASYPTKSFLHDALTNPRVVNREPWVGYENLWEVLNIKVFDKNEIPYFSYSVFWHGYLIFLKPLLVFFDIKSIRFINLAVQVGLLIMILVLMRQRLGYLPCAAFLVSLFLLNPIMAWQCLEYATDVNIMLVAVLWVLLNKNADDRYMFFVIGAVTILFDFLTFPLITLGVPLIIYVLLYEKSFKSNVICVLKNSLLWVSGYVLMLSAKWGIATLFTPYNVVQNGWESVLQRTYGSFENGGVLKYDYFSTVKSILSLYFVPNGWLFIILFVVILFWGHIGEVYKFKINKITAIICGIGCMPFVWMAILEQHTYIHMHLFTNKILVVTIYALLSAFVCCLKSKIKSKENVVCNKSSLVK